MKKIYIKPQIITHTIQFCETLLTGSDTKVGGTNDDNDIHIDGPVVDGTDTGDDM